MVSTAKQFAIEIMSRYPTYRAMPPGAVRTYAALKYHGQHSTRQEITRLVRSLDGIPVRYLSTALVAVRAAFRTGQDDLVTPTLDRLADRFPEAAGHHELRSDLQSFYGDYDAAIASAGRARLLDPASPAAAARQVRLAYRRWPRPAADQLAVEAVRRFPRGSEVLWAVAKQCDTAEQYARIRSAWDERVAEPADLPRAVRQLGMAATRARQIDAATDLYREAIGLLQQRRAGREGVRPAVRKLEGRGAWGAIEDVIATLDRAGVPFFFAAGTALGFVREGGPLSADNDIDVGILDEDWDRQALVDLFARDPKFDLDLHPLSKKVCVRHRGESPIDLFRFYREGGKMWHDGVFVRWHNTPFRVVRREIRGLSVPIPEDADTYLTENYGDWRTPNSAFDPFTEQAPNLDVTWPEYQRMHLVRRAYKQLTTGDAAAARESLARAGAEPAERIGAGA
jgi:tetratricopeptide (TPR) repeat protein